MRYKSTRATSRFLLLGELLVLDLVNTRVRRNGTDVDLLDTPAALTAWLRAEHKRIVWDGPATATDLAYVRALRDAIGQLLHALRKHTQPPMEAIDKINQALLNPAPQRRLAWTATGPYLAPRTTRSRRRALLHALAADAVALLTGPQAERLRECAHPDCILQFVALNARRRWCSGSLCGNRARVARHYLRQHEAR